MQMAPLQLSVRLALLIAAVCAVFLMIGGQAEAEGPNETPIEYVVVAGDTLWTIAQQHSSSGEDLRKVVHDIRRLSDTGDTIFPGQVLTIPAS